MVAGASTGLGLVRHSAFFLEGGDYLVMGGSTHLYVVIIPTARPINPFTHGWPLMGLRTVLNCEGMDGEREVLRRGLLS